MKLSIFTPTHDTRYLCDAYESLRGEDFDEWVILYNNGAEPKGFKDPRIREIVNNDLPPYVGALKRYAAAECSGDILLELDHDDMLLADACKEVKRAFAENPKAGLVYSNWIQTGMQRETFDRSGWAKSGWRFRPINVEGHETEEYVAFDPTPASVSRIWYAPNHLRAFRKDAYEAVGGYNAGMRVLDDQDLMSRLYAVSEAVHIDKALYHYRVHGQNAWLVHNQEIQENVLRLYDQYIEQMVLGWADRNALLALDLGGRLNPRPGYICVDYKQDPGVGIVTDLNDEWPFEDGSVGVIRAFDVFEHLRDPLHTMREMQRVLAPGGYAFLQVPSTDGRGAFQDPTHVSFWNENSFLYYCNRDWARWIDTPVRFQALRLWTTEKDAFGVCWVRADLMKLDGLTRVPGQVLI